MLLAGVLLIVVVIAVGTYRAWTGLDTATREAWWDALHENAYTLLALLAITALPPALLVPLPAWVPRWPFVLIGLGGWGLFVAGYWARRVVPAEALAPVAPPPARPDRTPASAPEEIDGDVEKQFTWNFTPRGDLPVSMHLTVTLSSERYATAREEERRPAGDWAHYTLAEMPEVDQLAAEFYRLHQDREWSTLTQASNVLCFTQACITYRYDADTTPAPDWPRYPIETLMEETGDCEDDVILTAAVLKRLGFDVALLYYPGHCALGLAGAAGLPGEYVVDARTDLHYFYGETTAEGWHLGEVPASYGGQSPETIEVVHRVVRD